MSVTYGVEPVCSPSRSPDADSSASVAILPIDHRWTTAADWGRRAARSRGRYAGRVMLQSSQG
jgi:hypothetical protein